MNSFFEMTIRVIGGLCSAHALSGRPAFITAAKKIADKMMPAFGYPFPKARVDISSGQAMWNSWFRGAILAEVGSIQLEFRYLSHATGDPKYAEAGDKAMDAIIQASGERGLIPYGLREDRAETSSGGLTMGAMADSYYEYLLKLWIQSGKTEDKFKSQYLKVIRDLPALIKTTAGGMVYVGEMKSPPPPGQWDRLKNTAITPKMEHLSCFIGGNLMLAAHTLPEEDSSREQLAAWGAGITETCHQMYARTPTGLGAEYTMFRDDSQAPNDMYVDPRGCHYLLRPEAIESIYYMHYYTGDPKYRQYAYDMLQALNKYARGPHGFSAIKDVRREDVAGNLKGEEESFFFAETLKYIYLTLAPKRGPVDLEKWVFNTEAHPLPVWSKFDVNKG
jgi:mannosyl-oligosaccharide alpha-1,2-mannosidase